MYNDPGYNADFNPLPPAQGFTDDTASFDTSEVAPAFPLRPLNDRVAIKRLDADKVTRGGIVIPDVAQEKPTKGLVLAVGPGKVLEDGSRGPMDVAVGDVVLFRKYGGDDFNVDGSIVVLINQDDLLAKIM